MIHFIFNIFFFLYFSVSSDSHRFKTRIDIMAVLFWDSPIEETVLQEWGLQWDDWAIMCNCEEAANGLHGSQVR